MFDFEKIKCGPYVFYLKEPDVLGHTQFKGWVVVDDKGRKGYRIGRNIRNSPIHYQWDRIKFFQLMLKPFSIYV